MTKKHLTEKIVKNARDYKYCGRFVKNRHGNRQFHGYGTQIFDEVDAEYCRCLLLE